MANQARVVLEVKDLDITFRMPTGDVHAIRGVSFVLRETVVMILLMCGSHLVSEGLKKSTGDVG